MKQFNVTIWEKEEYQYPMAFGFVPNITAYVHEDEEQRPCMLVVPGGGYFMVSPTEGEIVAKKFYEKGYQAFVLTYTTNLLMAAPLQDQPMKDLSRAIRLIRSKAEEYHVNPEQLVICGFSAGAHLCGSVCVHYQDVPESVSAYHEYSNRPDAAILSYPVISSGKYAHQDSFRCLFGKDVYEREDKSQLEYMSLENHVTADTPPCFLWQTETDETVPVENSALFATACHAQGVPFAYHVFSKGKHGLSLADEDWGYGRLGEPYTLAQIFALIEAVKSGQLPMPEEAKEMLLKSFDFSEKKDEAERADEINAEVLVWPELAEAWLNRIFER